MTQRTLDRTLRYAMFVAIGVAIYLHWIGALIGLAACIAYDCLAGFDFWFLWRPMCGYGKHSRRPVVQESVLTTEPRRVSRRLCCKACGFSLPQYDRFWPEYEKRFAHGEPLE